jgi:hypothetical protein
MVRFSDMLGGDGQPDDARAATEARDLPPLVDDAAPDLDAPVDEPSPPAAAAEAEVEAEPAAADPSPEDVLDRLTQYATATRAAAPPPEPEEEPPAPPAPPTPAAATTATPEPLPPPEPASPTAIDDTGDDILPRAKRSLRKPRGKRRDS